LRVQGLVEFVRTLGPTRLAAMERGEVVLVEEKLGVTMTEIIKADRS
jgi:hypothetical protein